VSTNSTQIAAQLLSADNIWPLLISGQQCSAVKGSITPFSLVGVRLPDQSHSTCRLESLVGLAANGGPLRCRTCRMAP
jgi:hypothetical protein